MLVTFKAHDLTWFFLRLTFDVSVHNHVAVQVGDSLQDLPAVSPGHLLRQSPVSLQLVLDRPLKAKNKGTTLEKGG